MSLPVVGEQDPREVRMAIEDDAVEVEGLPLVPVGGGEQRGHRRQAGIVLCDPHLHPETMPVKGRAQLVAHPVSGDSAGPIGRGHAGEEIEREVAIVPEPGELGEESRPVNDRRYLSSRDRHVRDARPHPLRELPRPHRTRPCVRTFSWSRRIPYISISGLGGQPGTYTSTGTMESTP